MPSKDNAICVIIMLPLQLTHSFSLLGKLVYWIFNHLGFQLQILKSDQHFVLCIVTVVTLPAQTTPTQLLTLS